MQRIARNCDFQPVSAEQNRQQYIRDAFINGISSSHIRQRLLENVGELSLEEAFTQARALEQAQSQSASYETVAVAAVNDNIDKSSLAAASLRNKSANYDKHSSNTPQSTKKDACYFCGNNRHPRSNCPARDSECRNCSRKGHWAKVCKSSSTNALGATGLVDYHLA